MRRVLSFVSMAVLLPGFAASAKAQCWSASAGVDSSATSDMRPSRAQAYEAVLLELEPSLQKVMGVSSKVYMTDTAVVRAGPGDGNVYFGRKFFDTLDTQYKNPKTLELIKNDVVPVGLKLILAHEFAHQFQFRMFKKMNIALKAPTPIDELQADALASYVLGSMFDAKYSHLPEAEKRQKVMDDSGGAIMVVALLGDEFFNDANHHGDQMTRRQVLSAGFEWGWINKFGALAQALTGKEDELYNWSRKVAEDTFKTQINGSTFSVPRKSVF